MKERQKNRRPKANQRQSEITEGSPCRESGHDDAKQLGGAQDKDLPEDPTIASVLAGSDELYELVTNLEAYRSAHPALLLVPDAESLGQFLKNARKVHRNAHPPSKRGPKFSEGRALAWISKLQTELKRRPTRKEILDRLTDIDTHGTNTVSQRTADKIAKLYPLLGRWGKRFSKTEARWLRKNFGPKGVSPHWWREKRLQWDHDDMVESGLSAEIKRIFTLSTDELLEERRKTEALRLEFIQKLINDRSPS